MHNLSSKILSENLERRQVAERLIWTGFKHVWYVLHSPLSLYVYSTPCVSRGPLQSVMTDKQKNDCLTHWVVALVQILLSEVLEDLLVKIFSLQFSSCS